MYLPHVSCRLLNIGLRKGRLDLSWDATCYAVMTRYFPQCSNYWGGGGYKPYRRIVKSTSHFLLNICEVSRLNRITWNKWKNFVFLRFCVGRKYFTLHEVLSKCTVLVLLGACSLDCRRQKKNCWTWIDNAGLYYIMVVCNVDHLLLWVHEVVPVRRWHEIFRSWKVSLKSLGAKKCAVSLFEDLFV